MQMPRCALCGFAAPEGLACPRCRGQAALAARFPPVDPGSGWVKSYFIGIDYYMKGYGFISSNPRLFKYIIIPLLISILIFVGMVAGGILLIPHALGFLDSEWISWLDWLRYALYWLFYFLLIVLCLLSSLFLTLFLSTIINAPFYDFLSEKVEEIYLGRSFAEPWNLDYLKRAVLIPLRESIKLALWQVGVTLILFVISLLSAGLGTVLFAVAGPYMASLTVFDFVMARKTYSLAEKRRFLRANQGFIMGFGTPAYLVPILTPFAVVGATLGFLSARNK